MDVFTGGKLVGLNMAKHECNKLPESADKELVLSAIDGIINKIMEMHDVFDITIPTLDKLNHPAIKHLMANHPNLDLTGGEMAVAITIWEKFNQP